MSGFYVAVTLVAKVEVDSKGRVTLGPLAGADLSFLFPGASQPFHRAAVTLLGLPVHPSWQDLLQEGVKEAAVVAVTRYRST